MTGYFANEHDRRAWIDGMRGLVDYLEKHPDVPVPAYGYAIQLSTYGTNAEAAETVDEFAEMVGVEPQRDGTHYRAVLKFGPIEFFCLAVRKMPKPRAPKPVGR